MLDKFNKFYKQIISEMNDEKVNTKQYTTELPGIELLKKIQEHLDEAGVDIGYGQGDQIDFELPDWPNFYLDKYRLADIQDIKDLFKTFKFKMSKTIQDFNNHYASHNDWFSTRVRVIKIHFTKALKLIQKWLDEYSNMEIKIDPNLEQQMKDNAINSLNKMVAEYSAFSPRSKQQTITAQKKILELFNQIINETNLKKKRDILFNALDIARREL